MSVIAARVKDKFIEIASDSIIIKDDLKRTNFKKLYQVSVDTIVGGCGSAEELSLFFQYAMKHVPQDNTISYIQDYMSAFAKHKEMLTQEFELKNEYLLIVKGHLFEVDRFFVRAVTDYTAIGEGEAYALAALHLGHDVTEAVEVACDLSCYVSRPVIQMYAVNKSR